MVEQLVGRTPENLQANTRNVYALIFTGYSRMILIDARGVSLLVSQVSSLDKSEVFSPDVMVRANFALANGGSAQAVLNSRFNEQLVDAVLFCRPNLAIRPDICVVFADGITTEFFRSEQWTNTKRAIGSRVNLSELAPFVGEMVRSDQEFADHDTVLGNPFSGVIMQWENPNSRIGENISGENGETEPVGEVEIVYFVYLDSILVLDKRPSLESHWGASDLEKNKVISVGLDEAFIRAWEEGDRRKLTHLSGEVVERVHAFLCQERPEFNHDNEITIFIERSVREFATSDEWQQMQVEADEPVGQVKLQAAMAYLQNKERLMENSNQHPY